MNEIIQESKLVHDEKCERVVAGTIISIQGAYFDIADLLDEDCFRDSKCLHIYNATKALANRGENIDIITVTAELAKNNAPVVPYDVASISIEGVVYDIRHLALRLKELSIRRRMWQLGQRLLNAGVTEAEDIADVQQKATEELSGIFGNTEGVFTLTQALISLTDIVMANMSKGTGTTGTRTGFRKFDEKGGMSSSDLIVIGGETSHGKSSLMMSILNTVIKNDKCAVYSMEMTKEQLTARLVSMNTGIPASDIMYSGNLRPDQLEEFDRAKKELPGDNLLFDDKSTSNIDSILLSIRNMKMRYNIAGAAIDYLQILSVNNKSGMNREQMTGEACRRFKNLAKELNIWIILLSQLTRNSQDPVPSLGRLRDSGQIEEAADVVWFVYRPSLKGLPFPYPFENIPTEDIPGLAMIEQAKGRNKGLFKFLVNFDCNTTHFTDMTDDSEVSSFDSYGYDEPVEEEAPF